MSTVSLRGLAVLAVSLLGVITAPAAAQDGTRLTRACVEEIRETTAAHIDRDRHITHRTIRAIRQSAQEGAPPRVLTAIASNGKDRIDLNTAHGHRVVHEIAARCINKLVEIGASEDLIRTVRRAAMAANERLDKVAERAKHAISKALAEALG